MNLDYVAIRYEPLASDLPRFRDLRPIVAFVDTNLETAGRPPPGPGGAQELAVGGTMPETLFLNARELGLNCSKLPAGINRIIFILDASSSMSEPVHHGVIKSKIEHTKNKLLASLDDYIDPTTKVSCLVFNDQVVQEYHGIGADTAGLCEQIEKIEPDGNTDFSPPFALAEKIIVSDLAAAAAVKEEVPRTLVIFLTDGEDQNERKATVFAEKLRRLNTATFLVGVGEDYRMPRIVELASQFGAASWSHSPMLDPQLDAFRRAIPDFIHNLRAAEHYCSIRASGDFTGFWANTQAMRPALRNSRALFGYALSSVGTLFERHDNVQLELKLRRYVTERMRSERRFRLSMSAMPLHISNVSRKAAHIS